MRDLLLRKGARSGVLLGSTLPFVFALLVIWTFTESRMAEGLGGATRSKVRIRNFRRTFFPSPGCVMDYVTFERGSGVVLAKAKQITVETTWLALATLSSRVKLLRLDELHVQIPAQVPEAVGAHSQKRSSLVGELIAHGTVVELGDKPSRYRFHKLVIHGAGKEASMHVSTELSGSRLPGLIRLTGSLGPLRDGATPLAGNYRILNGDLSSYPALRGLLDATGEMSGVLTNIAVRGKSVTQGFSVNDSPNRMRLGVTYTATVNAYTRDVTIQRAEADFLKSTLYAAGRVAGQDGKTVVLDFTSPDARVEDLIRLVTKNPNPALNGPISFEAHVELPPGPGKFLQRLNLNGRFGIDDARFARGRTQAKINELSARARSGSDAGEDGDDPIAAKAVVSDIKGAVKLRDGVADLSGISFRVPGAHATGSGQYNLLTKRIGLFGKLAMDASLSEAASGWKSVLLKPLNFLFRKENAGAVVGVSMTGSYPKPRVAVSLTNAK